ncbi:hypothetical protein [Sphingomonas endolithica]|uniref:hypothetical protein n=1 Tax=Sphingomonas endolithica TaxID=2972485 RepID=UPI0021AE900F|nr:hypothetical protein [Sphingomonas sp. ZFBP2030]
MPVRIVPAKHTGAIMIEWLTDELVIREMTDAELLAAYERTDGASGAGSTFKELLPPI